MLSEPGLMVWEAWINLPAHYAGVELGAFMVMPNHLHGIVVLKDDGGFSLPDVVHRYKSWTTTLYRRGVQAQQWKPVEKRFWHRNSYEHIIGDKDDEGRVRLYILDNPARWADDTLHP